MSLKAALEELGFGPCYHMVEVFEHPEHAATWTEASAGSAVDWQKFLAPYQAAVDWPACTFYQQLMQAFPDARVLLTVRDPDAWYDSARNTIYQATASRAGSGAGPGGPPAGAMINTIIWQRTFHGAFEDKERAIAIYEQHNRAVQEHVPAEKLLVYEVKDGWEPLCRFLNVPVPAGTPFPRLNDAVTFRQNIQERTQNAEGAPLDR